MRNKRIVSFILSFLILFNVQAPAFTESEKTDDGPQLHTVTWTLDPEYTLKALTPERTSMTEDGQVFTNTDGPARTEIQSAYHVNQTLVSVSMDGTGFSFAPIMHDDYYPDIDEDDPDEVDPEEPDNTEEPAETGEPEETPAPDEPADEPADKPTDEPTDEPTETPADEPAEEPTDTPAEDPTEGPAEEPTDEPAEDTATLQTGYGKTEKETEVYHRARDTEPVGKLPANVIVYIISQISRQWAYIVFDTPDGIVEGYVRANRLVNLDPEEEQNAVEEAKKQEDYREWHEHPLLRTSKYVITPGNTEEPSVSETPASQETPAPGNEPESDETPDPTETPSETPTTDETTDPEETEKPDETSTPDPTPTNTPDVTDTPVPETTDTPTPVPTDTPTPVPTDTPTPVPTDTPTPIPTDTPEPTPTESPAPDPTEVVSVTETPTENTDESDNNTGRGLFDLFISSAAAEEIQPEKEKTRPTVITGQKIGGSRGVQKRMLKSAAPASSGFSAALYSGLFDEATDVRLSATTTGVKEDILVSRYTGNHVYSYKLNTEDLTASLSGSVVNLIDSDGNCLARIEAPNMTDAAGNYSTDIAVTLTGNGGSYTLTYAPNDEWMKSAVYPVTIDPTAQYYNNLASGIGDNYVNANNGARLYSFTSDDLYVGKKDGGDYTAFVCPSLRGFEDSARPEAVGFPLDEKVPILIESVIWYYYVENFGDANAKIRVNLATSSWNSKDVTYNTKPSVSTDIYAESTEPLHKGWNWIDVTPLFSSWLNAWGQLPNYGFAVTTSSSWVHIYSADRERSQRMNFSATYYTNVPAPSVSAKTGGDISSGTGWVELSWNPVEGAKNYLLGIWTGEDKRENINEYRYTYVGEDVYTYTTKGKKLWITEQEDKEKKYVIHWDGKGRELTTVPREGVSNMDYCFILVPANKYGQTTSSRAAATLAVSLPDRLGPTMPTSVKVDPKGYTNAKNVTVSWSGITDVPSPSMDGGHIEYTLDPPANTKETTWTWIDTGVTPDKESFSLNVSGLNDGAHIIYIRGKDKNKNYGAAKGEYIYIDKKAPTTPTVSFTPDTWTSQAKGAVSWKGLSDELSNFRVEYRIDQGSYINLNKPNAGAGTVDTIDLKNLSEGTHTISIRGVDSVGNAGKEGTATIYIDRNGPTLSKDLTVEPADWTNLNTIKIQWFGAADKYSGLNKIAYAVDNSAFTDTTTSVNGPTDISVSGVSEGEHLARLKLTDKAGNARAYSAWFKIDRSAPTIGKVNADPATWTAQKELHLIWENAADQYSGFNSIKYAVDKGQKLDAALLASGFAKVNVSALADGIHSLTLYVKDKVGYETQKEVPIYIDRTSPIIREWGITPDIWSNDKEGTLTWQGVSDATSGLNTISYQIDTRNPISVSLKESDSASMDLSALADGKHTVTFRVTDKADVTAEDTTSLWIDRTSPTVEVTTITPDEWADTETVKILWNDVADAHSGLASVEYSLDNGLSYTALDTAPNGECGISVSEIPDGEQKLLLRFTDNAQNASIIPLTYRIDRAEPETEILYPAEGDIVTGVLDIQGSVTDISLKDWVFTAWDDSGKTVQLQGNEEKQAEQLGLLDTSVFPDGAEIHMELTAHDSAGHETVSQGICIKAVHQAQRVSAGVEITSPENNEVLSAVQTSGQYELQYSEEEAEGIAILDRNVLRKTEGLSFPLYPIIYPENSIHTVSVVSTDAEGQSHYSQGFQSTLAFSDLLQNDEKIADSSNVQFSETGALALADDASFTLKTISFLREAVAVRIHCVSNRSSAISCEYSIDNGTNWLPLYGDKDTVLPSPKKSIQIRCKMNNAGTVLQGMDLTEIHEGNPVRFRSNLLKPVHTYSLLVPAQASTAAVVPENNCDAEFASVALYVDGVQQDDSQTVHLLPYEDGTKHTVAQAGVTEDGELYGGGASSFVILRSAPDASDVFETGKIDLKNEIHALRAEALCMDENGTPEEPGQFEYSVDGDEWKTLDLSEYCFLQEATRTVYLRAVLPEGIVLKGIHVEGISLKNVSIIPILVKPAANVRVSDYGSYTGDLKRYVLSWTDPNEKDTTCDNDIFYDVYRDNELIASVRRTTFTDTEYIDNAVYKVAIRKVYEDPKDGKDNILTRESEAKTGSVTKVNPPVVVTPTPIYIADDPTPPPSTPKPTPRPAPEPVTVTATPMALPTYGIESVTPVPVEIPKLIEFEDPSRVYANMEYVSSGEIPAVDFALDQSLLGPHRFCSLGFEPINFNTGDFFVEARDFVIPDMGGTGLDLIRTYNSQSLTKGILFGDKWSCEAEQTLTMNENGVLCWKRSDGSVVRFMKKEDGHFITDTTEYEAIAETEEGYVILLEDGTGYGFDSEGSLIWIRRNGGRQETKFVRNENGRLEKVILPSGRELRVETNDQGQIVKIWLTNTSCVRYSYKGNMLAEVTDAEGNKTRYEYDPEGQMTAWYDGNGVCQAKNIYDDQNRVIAQIDANGGEYRLEYGDNYTTATDAEGNSVTYFRDEQQRTSKIVDAQGGETLFTYGDQGEIISETDPLGNVTMYDYDKLGNKISSTDARGESVFFTWDGAHHLLSRTDQNGNTTSYSYDKAGNVLTETAPDGGVISYTYDDHGQILSITDALGNATNYTYNSRGLLETVTDPLGNKTTYTYDEYGYPASETNALGETTQTKYDTKGNLLKITYADHTSVSYTYDALGRKTAMTDPKGNTIRYQYDGLGQLTRTTLPDGSRQEASYTRNGQTASVMDALGNTVSYTYDANGNRLTATDADGYTTIDTYDAAGHLLSETNALGGKTVYTYDSVGLPLTVTDPADTTQSFEYDGCGNILVRTLPNGARITAEYDSMNRVIRQVNAMGGETRISYDLLGRITEITDPLGARTSYTYDANGNVLTATDALGNTLSYTYDALNRVTEEKAPNGAVTKYEYDATGNLTASIDALGNTTTYEYDTNGNLTAVKDALGQVTTLKYDKIGQAISARQKNGGVLATAYDKAGRVASETDANGNTTKYSYNKRGLTTEITDALNQKANFEYDELGNISRIVAPDGGITLYEYDTAGRVEKTTDAAGCETVYTYNAAGQIASSAVNGNAGAYEYDAAGNISTVTDAESRTVRFKYDLAGNTTEVIYPDGSKATTEYDVLGRVVRQVSRTGLITEYVYDELGNTISVKQGDRTTRYEYDLLSRLVKTIAPDGSETSYEYDAIGNLITSTDSLGNKTEYAYTPESLLEKVTFANGAQQSLRYDLAGNMLSEIDAEGYTKKYQYDKVNRLTAVTDELGHRTSYTYDAADNITQVKDALGHITQYVYDTQGNLTEETDALGNTIRYAYTPEGWTDKVIKADGKEITFAYDKTGNLLAQKAGDEYAVSTGYNEMGQMTKLSSEEGDIVYQYNEQGYLVSVTNVKGETVRYTYDAFGNKETMILPDGREIRYTYDALNRLTSVKEFDGEETRYSYDAIGRRIKTESSTLTTAYEYDSVGNLIRQMTEGDSNVSFSYSHNKNGYITKEIRTENGEDTESTYTYDALGQLTAFVQSTGYGERYTYDAVGHMTQKTITPENKKAPVTLKMKYNKGNQLTEMLNGRNRISYSYDPNGSMVQKVLSSQKYGTLTDSYTYDVMDQLTGYTGYDGYTQAFTYDAGGMRLKKQEKGNATRSTLEELLRGNIEGLPEIVEPGTLEEDYEWATTEYLYDITEGYYQVLQETTTKGNEMSTSSYAYGLERIAGYTADTKTAYIYDGRGSVVQTATMLIAENVLNSQTELAQETGIQSFRYTPFGEQQHTKASGFTYNAEAYDAATGMLNLRARQYEATMNQFGQKDILKGQMATPLSLNRYGYCVNNPVVLVDPSGMTTIDVSTLKNFTRSMTPRRKELITTVANMVFGSNPVPNPVYDYMVESYSKLNNNSQEIINQAINDIKQVDLNPEKSMQVKRRENNAIQWETCYAVRESEGGIPIYDDYFEKGTAANTVNYWNAVMDYSEKPLPGNKVYQTDLVESGVYIANNSFAKVKDNKVISNPAIELDCINGVCGHNTHNTLFVYDEYAKLGDKKGGKECISCNGEFFFAYAQAQVSDKDGEASNISSTQSAFQNSVAGTQYYLNIFDKVDKRCIIPGTAVYTYLTKKPRDNKKEVTLKKDVLDGTVKLKDSLPGHMMMYTHNGKLTDPAGKDIYPPMGVGIANIQNKGDSIGWPDGVVLYDKQYGRK